MKHGPVHPRRTPTLSPPRRRPGWVTISPQALVAQPLPLGLVVAPQWITIRAPLKCDGDAAARKLVSAIGDYANRRHWSHTTLGVLAARRGDVSLAKAQLRDSAAVRGDHRLSSYGPSLLLASELCALGEWDAAADYLETCAAFWNPEPLREWVRQLRERQMPEPFEVPDAD
jgi:hypothetical protein